MNLFKLSPDTLYNLTCDVIDTLEYMIPESSFLSNNEVYAQLEETLGYSLVHIRNVFDFSTGTTLAKYITRRKYTYLLLKISAEKFEQLTMHATVFFIQKFKTKCLQEFPELATSYSLKHMQLPIDKLFLREHIHMLFLEKSETELLKSFYFNITADRIAFDIKKNSKNLVVQSFGGKFIDLERNYFVFRNKIFKIITAICNVPQQTADPFLSSLLGQPVILSENHPADANSVVHKLHQFLTDNVPLTESFSVMLEWGAKNGWGSSNLISSLTVKDGKIQEVEFVSKPFLVFDDENVRLDLSFFD